MCWVVCAEQLLGIGRRAGLPRDGERQRPAQEARGARGGSARGAPDACEVDRGHGDELEGEEGFEPEVQPRGGEHHARSLPYYRRGEVDQEPQGGHGQQPPPRISGSQR